MNHYHYYARDSKPFHPGLLILAGMMMGSSNGALYYMQWLLANVEWLLVSGYTVAVLVYLTWLAFWKRIEKPIEKKQEQRRGDKPAPPRVTFQEPSTQETAAAAAAADVAPEEAKEEIAALAQPVDMSGAYKLISNDGFEEFLAVQGVPWALRRAANQARPVHRITHRGSQLTIKIEGIIESQTTYVIGGPPVETNVRGRIFEDSVEYLKDHTGIIVSKRAVTEDYDVTVQRVLSEDKQQITMTSTACFRDGRETVRSLQIFERCE